MNEMSRLTSWVILSELPFLCSSVGSLKFEKVKRALYKHREYYTKNRKYCLSFVVH